VSARFVVRRHRFSRRRLSTLACAAVLLVGLAACGKTGHPATLDNDGVYVDAGPITYQLQVSRELNQYATEDAQYLAGLPAGSNSLSAGQEWYGVFLWAKNQTKRQEATNDSFDIVDTQGHHYYPMQLTSSLNQYAWTAQTLAPGATEPAPDTTASFGPTQGGLLLFKLNISAYDNRPLTLEIRAPSQQLLGTISLDL
jgi:hypothetical protein